MASMAHKTVNLTIRFEDGGGGWISGDDRRSAGAISQGRTRAEARANIIDALQTVLTPDDQLAGSPSSADDEQLTLTVAE